MKLVPRMLVAATVLWPVLCSTAGAQALPALRNRQLIVDGKPFLALGGELHNSSASVPENMKPIWAKLAKMNVRTVISTVSWEDFEPVPGQYDYTAIDAQIAEARQYRMRIVLIWFGAFKNATSTYAPSWVRKNTVRFPRIAINTALKEGFSYEGAMPKPVLSVFSKNLLDADRAAFSALIKHIAEVDTDHRIIMMQVNNETGMLGDSRDRSALANAAWQQPVPDALLKYLADHRATLKPELAALWARQGSPRSGTWSKVFGADWQADEVFMAWNFATYMNALAAAGKRVLPLPTFVNAWLGPQAGQPTAGLYPSGGPTRRVLDIWRAAAPSIDLLAPDIYAPNTKEVLRDYDHDGNPIFVPEAKFRTGDIFWALGQHAALGYSVFGIEDGRVDSQLAQAYALLDPMHSVIAKAQAEKRIAGILLDRDEKVEIKLGGYTITVQESHGLLRKMLLDIGVTPPPVPGPLPSETEGASVQPAPGDGRAFGFVIDEGDGNFLIVGKGFNADFATKSGLVEVDHIEEGRFDAVGWKRMRVLNGDERLIPVPMDRISVVRMRLLKPMSR